MALMLNQGWIYDQPGVGSTTVELNIPILALVPGSAKTRYVRESEDKTVIDVTTVGDGVAELSLLIRMQAPTPLMTMLGHAADGVPITFYPDLGDLLGDSYPCRLVGMGSLVELEPDQERPFGEYQIRIRVRRLDGGNFDPLLVAW